MSLLGLAVLAFFEPTLTFEDGAFIVSESGSEIRSVVKIAPEPAPIEADRFKVTIDGVLVTFDKRGLGIQYRGKGGFSGLTYVPTTYKAFNAQEIALNAASITSGQRSDRVAALSGSEVVGNVVYLLLRWEEKDGKPWFEGVVAIEVSGDDPVTKFLGRVEGLSMAKGLVSDTLFVGQSGLIARVVKDGKASVAIVALPGGGLSYRPFASSPQSLIWNDQLFYELEKSDYGSTILSVFDEANLTKRSFFETRDEIVEVGLPGAMVVKEGGVVRLLSLESGAMTTMDADSGFATTPLGVLVWSPKLAPKSAALLERGGWTKSATWTAVKKP